MSSQMRCTTAGAAAQSPLRDLPQHLQAQLMWIVFMGATLLLALAAAGSSVVSCFAAAAGHQLSFQQSMWEFDCADPAEAFYAPGAGSSSSRLPPAAAWAVAGAAAGQQQLRVRVMPAAASSGSAAASLDPCIPPQLCHRKRTSLLWTIPE